MIAVRSAVPGDRDDILGFCANTFSWGDYIDRVWDLWLNDNSGRLLVAEAEGQRVGLAHVAICPDTENSWLEGVRIHPSRRRSGLASALIGRMIEFAREKGAARALAIVAKENTASKRMLERNGFSVISEWAYYSTEAQISSRPSGARLALPTEIKAIMGYLEASDIYRHAAKMYVNSWHWYVLDAVSLKTLLSQGRVVVSGDPVAGMAVINRQGYWSRKNIIQVVYLDSRDKRILRDLLAFVANLYRDEKYARLHVLCQRDEKMIHVVQEFKIQESEQFLLYSKFLTG